MPTADELQKPKTSQERILKSSKVEVRVIDPKDYLVSEKFLTSCKFSVILQSKNNSTFFDLQSFFIDWSVAEQYT